MSTTLNPTAFKTKTIFNAYSCCNYSYSYFLSFTFGVFFKPHVSSAPIVPLVNSGNSGSASNDWPMFHADSSHSGVATSNPVLTPTLIWKYTAGNSIASSPAVSNGVVYIGSDDKNLYALNATSGDKLWNNTLGGYYVITCY